MARAAWADYFRNVDVFLSPATLTSAIAHDARPFEQRTVTTSGGPVPYEAQTFWSAHASLSGLPPVVAPAGTTPDGLPVGVQLVGPAHEDDAVITVAELLDELTGGYQVPPPCR